MIHIKSDRLFFQATDLDEILDVISNLMDNSHFRIMQNKP